MKDSPDARCNIEITVKENYDIAELWHSTLVSLGLKPTAINQDSPESGKISFMIRCQLTFRQWRHVYRKLWNKPCPGHKPWSYGQMSRFRFVGFPRGVHPAGSDPSLMDKEVEFTNRKWNEDALEAQYRRSDSKEWVKCQVNYGNKVVSSAKDVAGAKKLICDWAKSACGAELVNQETLEFLFHDTKPCEFRIVRVKAQYETLEYIPQ